MNLDRIERPLCMAGLVLLSPVLAAVAVAVALEDGRPVLFRQVRAGRNGSPFNLLKFRSMRVTGAGTRVTASGDSRITRTGRILRKFKLDELPQLWNVVRGDISLIGPRPEVPAFVDLADPAWREVLEVRPGITDLATLVFRNEEQILGAHSDPEYAYRRQILPAKLQLNLLYIRHRSLLTDLRLLAMTIYLSLMPDHFDSGQIQRQILGDARS
ncbi:MAG: sugar transferase [Bryobacteraceae bacterium]|nr:sugar transferase [Bryobacteraceae bacterium]